MRRPGQAPPPSFHPRASSSATSPYVTNAGPQQTLDIYAPPATRDAKGAPVVIYVHSGEWTKGDKAEVSYKPRFFNEHGIVFVSANYRLSGTAKHPAQVNDVAAAVRWVRDHITAFGGDPHQLVLMGHSAGCHIAAMVGLDPRPLATVGLQPADLKAVVSWSGGAFDLVAKVAQGGMYADYIRLNFGPDEKTWRDASPMAHVGEAKPMPPFLFASAENDKGPSIDANRKMVSLVHDAGGTAEFLLIPGKDHFYMNHEVGMPGDTSGQLLLRFIGRGSSK